MRREAVSCVAMHRGRRAVFNRAGLKIPGVAAHELTTRLGYDQPNGPLKGTGAFIKYHFKSCYFVDNGNQLAVPGYGTVNFNAHYDMALPANALMLKNFTAFVEVQNIFDRRYVASANNISDSLLVLGVQNPGVILANTGTGSIYAGAPRGSVGGVKFKF
jgi:iron complex outermembrane receptor protein